MVDFLQKNPCFAEMLKYVSAWSSLDLDTESMAEGIMQEARGEMFRRCFPLVLKSGLPTVQDAAILMLHTSKSLTQMFDDELKKLLQAVKSSPLRVDFVYNSALDLLAAAEESQAWTHCQDKLLLGPYKECIFIPLFRGRIPKKLKALGEFWKNEATKFIFAPIRAERFATEFVDYHNDKDFYFVKRGEKNSEMEFVMQRVFDKHEIKAKVQQACYVDLTMALDGVARWLE